MASMRITGGHPRGQCLVGRHENPGAMAALQNGARRWLAATAARERQSQMGRGAVNCWRCQDGAKPCVEGMPHHNCAYPSKRPLDWPDAIARAKDRAQRRWARDGRIRAQTSGRASGASIAQGPRGSSQRMRDMPNWRERIRRWIELQFCAFVKDQIEKRGGKNPGS